MPASRRFAPINQNILMASGRFAPESVAVFPAELPAAFSGIRRHACHKVVCAY